MTGEKGRDGRFFETVGESPKKATSNSVRYRKRYCVSRNHSKPLRRGKGIRSVYRISFERDEPYEPERCILLKRRRPSHLRRMAESELER